MWELDFQVSAGSIGEEVATLVADLVSATDAGRAYDFAVLIESRVAPTSGGLGAEVAAVVASVIAGLSRMDPSVRSEALFLLSQIAGSLVSVDARDRPEAASNLVAALPFIAGLAESGSQGELSQFVDLVSLCVSLDRGVGQRASYYLSRIASEVGGDVGASARRELGEIRDLLA